MKSAVAQEKGLPGNYEHLKKLEHLIGTWTGEFVSPHDWPTANVKKGDKLTHTLTYKWGLNKSIITNHQAWHQPGSDPVWQGTFLIGWDTLNKRIVSFSFENTGGHQVIDKWEIQADKVTLRGKGSDPFGNETTFAMVLSDINKDSLVWQIIDTTIDGKRRPDSDKRTLKRVHTK
jgi:hypothetical protein